MISNNFLQQDPVLFLGNLRLNLDPLNKHTDEELWQVLDVSHLKNFVSLMSEGLQYTIAEGGGREFKVIS